MQTEQFILFLYSFNKVRRRQRRIFKGRNNTFLAIILRAVSSVGFQPIHFQN